MRFHGIAQALAVANHLTINESHHMLSNTTLLIEHISPRPFILLKVMIEHLAQRGSRNFARRTFDMTLNVSSESNGRHTTERSIESSTCRSNGIHINRHRTGDFFELPTSLLTSSCLCTWAVRTEPTAFRMEVQDR